MEKKEIQQILLDWKASICGRRLKNLKKRMDQNLDVYKITTYNKMFNNFDLFPGSSTEVQQVSQGLNYKHPEVGAVGPVLRLNQRECQDFRWITSYDCIKVR